MWLIPREACLEEAGDLIIPNAEIRTENETPNIVKNELVLGSAEIGEIVNGDKSGRQSDDEITFFKSVGVAVQDAVAGAAVLAAAEAKGLGVLAGPLVDATTERTDIHGVPSGSRSDNK